MTDVPFIGMGVHLTAVIEIEPIFERRSGDLRRGGGMPPHTERYERIGVDVHALLRGAG